MTHLDVQSAKGKRSRAMAKSDIQSDTTIEDREEHVLQKANDKLPKYMLIFESLKRSIVAGEYKDNPRLPSELDVAQRFNVSRMTAVKAFKKLQQMGLVTRRVGSGTFAVSSVNESHLLFGLLISDLGQTEIFEPICQGLSTSPLAPRNSLLWGSSSPQNKSDVRAFEGMCQRYIEQRVSGVFFAPLEIPPNSVEVNGRIAEALYKAKIPLVLLDKDITPYPTRSAFDLVGIDNRRTAFIATEHLAQLGAKRISFFAREFPASTVTARIAGYREAIFTYRLLPNEDLVEYGDPSDTDFVRSILDDKKPDAFVCANDITAAHLMQSLLSLGRRVPADVRMVGIDDVKYASLLPIPLTTQHQPCIDLGMLAMSTMLDRLERPDQPPREITLTCKLVVRQSCGALNHF